MGLGLIRGEFKVSLLETQTALLILQQNSWM